MTVTESIKRALLARGETVVKELHKRTVFTRKDYPDGHFFYVGRAGSLRTGRTVGTSIPVSEKHKAALITEGGKQL